MADGCIYKMLHKYYFIKLKKGKENGAFQVKLDRTAE